MGKPTGFMDYVREDVPEEAPERRVEDYAWFHGELSEAERREQAGRCMDCGVPFCQAGLLMRGRPLGCPLKNLIPEWNDQLWRENLPMALERLLRTNPFPEFTGYVCPAPCEKACACGRVNQPVTINANERYIIDEAFARGLMTPQVPPARSGMRVAVVGSGPAGLAAAQLLNRRGHRVTVYERAARPGGLLSYGIPNMKLPKDVVARRIALMEAEGVEFQCGVDVGRDVNVGELRDRYDAVVLAIGAGVPRKVAFEGTAPQAGFALDFLGAQARAQYGEAALPEAWNARGKVVAIVGAGDSANDCIATALRQGAADIIQLIRRPAADYGPMTDYAHVEAASVLEHDIRRFQTTVAAVHVDEAGNLSGLTLNTPDGPAEVQAQMLVIASGFSGAETYATEGLELNEREGVFCAGDMVLGSTLVVRAMADAREVAGRVETFLLGY